MTPWCRPNHSPQSDADLADGFVPKCDDWRAEVDWADVIVFDDVLGMGAMAQEMRQARKLVVGGSPYSDRLEDDRAFGQQELRAAGVSIIPQENFTSFDDAMDFVRANPNRYVIKPSGEAQNYKRLLFVGEEEDGRDVVQVLEDYKRAWSDRIREFQLQRRIIGVEVATGAFFNGREFVYPISSTTTARTWATASSRRTATGSTRGATCGSEDRGAPTPISAAPSSSPHRPRRRRGGDRTRTPSCPRLSRSPSPSRPPMPGLPHPRREL